MIKEKYFLLTTLIAIISALITHYYSQFHYDGHHYSLVFDNSLDFINGKKPFKEIFLLYGIGTVLFHSLAIIIFGEYLQSLMLFTSIIYSLSLIFIFFLSNKFINKNYSFYLVLIIFLIHPVVEYPWANYLVFFLFLFALNLIFLSNKTLFTFSCLLIGFCSLIRIEIILYILSIFLYISYMSFRNKDFNQNFKFGKNLYFLVISFLPIIFFLIYLKSNDLLEYYKNFFSLPEIFLEHKNTNVFNLFLNLIKYLYFFKFSKFFFEPYLLIFAFSLIFNLYYIFKCLVFSLNNEKLTVKKIQLSVVSVISILFITQSLNEINVFRLICGSSLGFITIFYYLEKLNKKYSAYIILAIILISFSSLSLFQRNNSNTIFKYKSEIQKSIPNSLSYFSKNIYKKDTTNNLQTADKIFKKIKDQCNITYFANLQKDIAYRLLAKKYYKTFKIVPFYEEKKESYAFVKYFDNDFFLNLKKLIDKNQVVIIVDYKNLKYIKFNTDIIYFKNYKISKILPFSYEQKLKVILTPKNCNLE